MIEADGLERRGKAERMRYDIEEESNVRNVSFWTELMKRTSRPDDEQPPGRSILRTATYKVPSTGVEARCRIALANTFTVCCIGRGGQHRVSVYCPVMSGLGSLTASYYIPSS